MDAAAPLLCAGITTYSPLMHYGLNKAGMKIGVVGLGGLGHMAVKIGKAMGLEVHAPTCPQVLNCKGCPQHEQQFNPHNLHVDKQSLQAVQLAVLQ